MRTRGFDRVVEADEHSTIIYTVRIMCVVYMIIVNFFLCLHPNRSKCQPALPAYPFDQNVGFRYRWRWAGLSDVRAIRLRWRDSARSSTIRGFHSAGAGFPWLLGSRGQRGACLGDLKSAGTLRAAETELSAPNGRSLHVLISAAPIRPSDGETGPVVVPMQGRARFATGDLAINYKQRRGTVASQWLELTRTESGRPRMQPLNARGN